MTKNTNLTINCDASFHPIHMVGGYAFWIVCDLFKITKGGKFKNNPTNPEEAEIMCIGNAIATLLAQKELPKVNILTLNSDCKYGMDRIKNRANDKAIIVHDLWVKLSERVNAKKVQMLHVKAHSGKKDNRSYVNEWCDLEAKKWMRLSINKK